MKKTFTDAEKAALLEKYDEILRDAAMNQQQKNQKKKTTI